jgi:hypothetical protein
VVLLARCAGDRPRGFNRAPALAMALGVVIIFHGAHLQAEGRITDLSHRIWPLSLCDRRPGALPLDPAKGREAL